MSTVHTQVRQACLTWKRQAQSASRASNLAKKAKHEALKRLADVASVAMPGPWKIRGGCLRKDSLEIRLKNNGACYLWGHYEGEHVGMNHHTKWSHLALSLAFAVEELPTKLLSLQEESQRHKEVDNM